MSGGSDYLEDFTSFWERGGTEGGHVMLIDFATVCHSQAWTAACCLPSSCVDVSMTYLGIRLDVPFGSLPSWDIP